MAGCAAFLVSAQPLLAQGYPKLGNKLCSKVHQSCAIRMQTQSPAFVAGGTGRVGRRVVWALAKRGIPVRVGCRDVSKGRRIIEEELIGSEREKVEYIKFDVTKTDEVNSNILGNVNTVISAMGIGEKELGNVFGPYSVDGKGASKLIEIARKKGIEKFILVTSLGTGTPWKWPTGLYNLLWGILVWKKKGEDALIDSRMNYTIIRPGGMERAKDDYKETHDVVVSPANTKYGGQVSRLQVAEVIVESLLHPESSKNKILELTTKEKSSSDRASVPNILQQIEAIPQTG